jgi:hypothetical protein
MKKISFILIVSILIALLAGAKGNLQRQPRVLVSSALPTLLPQAKRRHCRRTDRRNRRRKTNPVHRRVLGRQL